MGYNRFQIGCVFAEYDLFKHPVIQNCIYMNICIVLTQFYIISRDRYTRQMSYMYCLTPGILRCHPIIPPSFSFTVPLS